MSPEQLNHYSQAALSPTFAAMLELLGPGLVSFSLSAAFFPFYIGWLKRLNIDQTLREEGPKSHAHKAKTPTMGGLFFMGTMLLGLSLLSVYPALKISIAPKLSNVAAVAAIGFMCGIVGLLDDAAKVRQKANKGISGYVRLGSETILGAVLGFVLAALTAVTLIMPHSLAAIFGLTGLSVDHVMAAQASSHYFLTLPMVLVVLLSAFLTAATTNAVNLHDGMDGLAAGTATQVFATIAVMLFATGQDGYATISATASLTLLGFLIYNRNPAKIFMGDTGSLFIGGLMASLVLAGGLTLYFVPLSLIYIVEALSVMMQVTYFKLTKPYKPEKPMSAPALIMLKLTKRLPGEGKRLFRMAPLHHHFEAVLVPQGWTEWQVVAAFWAVQFLLCLVTLAFFSLS